MPYPHFNSQSHGKISLGWEGFCVKNEVGSIQTPWFTKEKSKIKLKNYMPYHKCKLLDNRTSWSTKNYTSPHFGFGGRTLSVYNFFIPTSMCTLWKSFYSSSLQGVEFAMYSFESGLATWIALANTVCRKWGYASSQPNFLEALHSCTHSSPSSLYPSSAMGVSSG